MAMRENFLIRLDADLLFKARAAKLNISKVCREALEQKLSSINVDEEVLKERALELQREAEQKATIRNNAKELIQAYVKFFREYYGVEPVIDQKARGQALNACKVLSLDKLIKLVEVFFQMDDWFFKSKGHDLSVFCLNLNKIALAYQTGRDFRDIVEEKANINRQKRANVLLSLNKTDR